MMYSADHQIQEIFNTFLSFVKPKGYLLMRESVNAFGKDQYKSKSYVAYYRNVLFYESDFFKKYFIKKYRSYSYSHFYLDKYKRLNPEHVELLYKDIDFLKQITHKHVDIFKTSQWLYLYKKGNNEERK